MSVIDTPTSSPGPRVDEDGPLGSPTDHAAESATAEEGSLVTEYGLLAIVAATIAAAAVQWASDGAVSDLFNALLRQARDIVGV